MYSCYDLQEHNESERAGDAKQQYKGVPQLKMHPHVIDL